MSYVTTPTKTPAETLSNGVLIGGRLSVALVELQRRLETELPPLIDYVNAEHNLTGARKIEQFSDGQGGSGVGLAPSGDLTEGHINRLMIDRGESGHFEPIGSRGFKYIGSIALYMVAQPYKQGDQFLASLDREGVVRLLLANYLSHTVDPQGRRVWSELVPLSDGKLPYRFTKYGGVSFNYQVLQSAGDDLWAV